MERANQHKFRNFNPRSREGSDAGAALDVLTTIIFQSTLPRGERRRYFRLIYNFFLFQSTLPRGERQHLPACILHIRMYFNPRSREGSDFSFSFPLLPLVISIHAPARGATSILSKIHPMFLTISHNASSFSSFPFHSFLPHLLNSSTFCALFQVRISRAFSVYYRFAPKKSTPDL